MKIDIIRQPSANGCTLSSWSINGVHQCYGVEDVVRTTGPKVWGQTAIPAGTYQVVVDFSNRFQKQLPLLLNVPGYAGVRIHPGNTAADSSGCLLPGVSLRPDGTGVNQSVVAFNALFAKIRAAMKTEKVTLTIR